MDPGAPRNSRILKSTDSSQGQRLAKIFCDTCAKMRAPT